MKIYMKPEVKILRIDERCENILRVSFERYDDDWGVQDEFIY